MAALSTQPNPLKWTGGFYNREPLWPVEPDMIIIKSLALQYLTSELPDTLDLDMLEVHFFAQGGFNKLYSISCSGHYTSYLLRVALPLVPYYKTESEAAVLSYLKRNTSIPVARVIAWNSSAATDLGFEWILLEKIEGVPLYDIWRTVPWGSKLEIISALAPLLGQLRDHKFERIGSLYFKGRDMQPSQKDCSRKDFPSHGVSIDSLQFASGSNHHEDGYQLEQPASDVAAAALSDAVSREHDSPLKLDTGTLNVASANDRDQSQTETFADEIRGSTTEEEVSEQNIFVVGPLLDSLFFLYRRLYLPGNRGPFRTSREWMAAAIDFQMSWIKTGPLIKTSTNPEDFDRFDWDSDCDEAPEMKKLIDDYQDVLPEVFPAVEGASPYTLYHHDLSLANILVDPETYQITGIIDWETIQVVPEWKSSRFPKFLTYQIDFEEIDDEEPRLPTPAECDEDSDYHNPVVVEHRDRWDNRILRQHYDESLSRTRGEEQFSGYTSDSARTKREFEAMTMEITDDAHSARTWLERYSKNRVVAAGDD